MNPAAHPLAETPRSAPLRARMQVLQAKHATTTRGAKFREQRADNQDYRPDFAEVAALPDWVLWDQNDRNRLAKAVATLCHRPAIDQELSGAKLGALAETVGEQLFEALCHDRVALDTENPYWSQELPRPEDLQVFGERLMHAALPKFCADRYPGADDDADAHECVAEAMAICAQVHSDASEP